MISKNEIKRIKLLKQKKYRNKYNLFIVEGEKSVLEFLRSNFFIAEKIYYTSSFNLEHKNLKSIKIDSATLNKISFLTKNQQVLGIFKIKRFIYSEQNKLIIALDSVQDPGNLGTIIRLCDWFGVSQIVCSLNTVDCFNPKVVQATMGSLNRVNVIYTDLNSFLNKTKKKIYATVTSGNSIYKSELKQDAVILLGNESNGISKKNLDLANSFVTIPRFGNLQETESLNVAMASAVLLSEFKR